MPNFTSDRRLYLTADKARVVDEGDAEAAFLLVGEGGELPEEEAEKYGLTGAKAKAKAADKAQEPSTNK